MTGAGGGGDGVAAERQRISFVVPVYNGARFIGGCLQAIFAEAGPADEVIVVDNGSVDGTAEEASRHPRAIVLRIPRSSIGAARNFGAGRAGGEIIGFVDADCRLCSGWRRAVLGGLADPGVCAVGSRYDLPAEPGWIESAWFSQRRRTPGRAGYINSGNLAIRRRVFAAVGGFDESLETGEDAELGWRLRAAGHVLAEIPAVRAVHLGNPKDLVNFYRKQRWHGLGMFGTFRINPWDKPLIMTILFLGTVIAAAGSLAGRAGWPGGESLLLSLGLVALVPLAAALYRCVQFRSWRHFHRLVLLYLVYFAARGEAMGRLLGRGLRRSGTGA